MSASQDKKRRQIEKTEGVDKRAAAEREAAKKAKKEKRTWTIGGIIFAVVVLIVILLNTNLLYTGTTSVTIGDETFNNAEFQYYYHSAVNNFEYNYSSYLSYIYDSSTPLDEQAYSSSMLQLLGLDIPDAVSGDNETEDLTWEDYFVAVALESMQEVTALYDAAIAEGYTLSEDDQASIDSTIEGFETAAEAYGWRDGDAYVSALYGKGVDLDLVREQLERSIIAGDYSLDKYDSFEYSEDELAAYYEEYKDVFDVLDFEYYLVSAETVESTETVVDEETGEETEETTSAVTDETMADAKAIADDIAAAYNASEPGETAFADAIAEVEGDEAGEPSDYANTYGYYASSYLNSNIAEWVLDESRSEGDCAILEYEGNGYYVVVFNSRTSNDYNTVSFRHILVMAEDTDEDGEYSEEELNTALEEIESIYEEWQSGDATEESFYTLQQEYSDDVTDGVLNGDDEGVYTNVARGAMVTDIDEYIYDESRVPGDTAILFGESSSYTGYHLVYFVGVDDELYCDYLADNGISGTEAEGLRAGDYVAWRDEVLEQYPVSKNSFVSWFARLA